MRQVMASEEMRACDETTIKKIGVPSLVLMERASLAIADEVMKAPVFQSKAPGEIRILCVCGTGNNGGDGAAAARILSQRGISCDLTLCGNPEHLTEEMKRQLQICRNLSLRILKKPVWKEYDLMIDALFGIGLSRAPEGVCARAIRAMNASSAFVVSADIPSGVRTDDGAVLGCAVRADVTVTMQFEKPGLLLYPGASFSGKVTIADIGIVASKGKHPIRTLQKEDLLLIPERDPHGNKGSFGKVLVIAGRKNISGSSYFTCLSALKAGAGMVRLLTAEENRVIFQEALPEALLSTFGDAPTKENVDRALEELEKGIAWADVIACGPGIGTDALSEALVRSLLLGTDKPLVLDADALNCLSGSMMLLKQYRGFCLVTPHPKEMSRMTGIPVSEITGNLPVCASSFAKKYGVTCLLKDARTVTASPRGDRFINLSGNDGMAKAGSGDVLTGIAAALLARGTDPACAGAVAALLHGAAGDAAAVKKGKSGMLASDIIDGIAEALPKER